MNRTTDVRVKASGDPEVSIIIPVYDQKRLLVEALDTIHSQTFDDFEVIIVDDGSSVEFAKITETYDDSVSLISHDQNKGAAAARNTGMEAAKGNYIAFLDADDLWRPTKLEKQLAAFEHGGDDLGLVYTGFIQYEVDGTTWTRHPSVEGYIYVEELERDQIHPTSTVMIRRECIDTVGGFDPQLPSRQDYDLWIRITERFSVSYVDEILVEKREQTDSISKNFERRIEGDRAVLQKVRGRIDQFDRTTRNRILSYHYHVLGRDYESNGNRYLAIKHLLLSIRYYPFRPISWAILAITILGIDRNGKLLTAAKSVVR